MRCVSMYVFERRDVLRRLHDWDMFRWISTTFTHQADIAQGTATFATPKNQFGNVNQFEKPAPHI